MTELTNIAADLIQGAEAIAEFCRECGLKTMNAKKVCQWREAGKLPVGKVGGHLIASKSAIAAALVEAATKAASPPPIAAPVRPSVKRRYGRSA